MPNPEFGPEGDAKTIDVTTIPATTDEPIPPGFELNRKSVSYPFETGIGAHLATLRWPEPVEVRELLKGVRLVLDEGREEIKINDTDRGPIIKFLTDYLIGIRPLRKKAGEDEEVWTVGEEINLEETLDHLKRNAYVAAAWSRSLIEGNLLLALMAGEEAEQPNDFGSLFDPSLAIKVPDWDADAGRFTWHVLTAKLKPASLLDVQDLDKAEERGVFTKSGQSWRKVNPLKVTNVFERRVVEIDGLLIGGKPCVMENQQRWLKKVPYQWVRAFAIAEKQKSQAQNFTSRRA